MLPPKLTRCCCGNDIDAEFASKLVRGFDPGAKSAAEAVRSQLAAQIQTDSTIAQDGKAVILMGPPACGKNHRLDQARGRIRIKARQADRDFLVE